MKANYLCSVVGTIQNDEMIPLSGSTEFQLTVVLDDNGESSRFNSKNLREGFYSAHKQYSCFSGDINIMSREEFLLEKPSSKFIVRATENLQSFDTNVVSDINVYRPILASDDVESLCQDIIGDFNLFTVRESAVNQMKVDNALSLAGNHAYKWISAKTAHLAKAVYDHSNIKPDAEQWVRSACSTRNFAFAKEIKEFAVLQKNDIASTIALLEPLYSEKPLGLTT